MTEQTQERQNKRKRRSTGHILELLMAAAAEEFEEKGYSGATTAAIAKRAGVREALLFNHFGSKSQLFHDTIFQPLQQHFDTFTKTHPSVVLEKASHQMRSKAYIGELQKFISQHSRMLLSLVFAQTYKTNGVEGLGDISGLNAYFERMSAIAAQRLQDNPKINPKWMTRISFATILSCVLFSDWLFPDYEGEEEDLYNAISDFVLEGLSANAQAVVEG